MGASQRIRVARDLRAWKAAGQHAVLATVTRSSDSAPRGVGAQLAVTEGGLWTGALSGGCAEVEVLAIASELLAATDDGADVRAVHTTMTREQLGSGGPMCGATLDIVIERVDGELLDYLERSATPTRELEGAREWRAIEGPRAGMLERAACSIERLTHPDAAAAEFEATSTGATFTERLAPAPRLVVAGAGDVAAELLRHAGALGWRTTLLDPRSAFVEQTLVSAAADEIVSSWPRDAVEQLALDARCACVAAAHHDRIDELFLEAALESDAFYVGSIGSRVVQRARRDVLAVTFDEQVLARHHGPAGLDLGGGDAAEIALSIIAEAVAASNGRSGGPLRESHSSIRAR